MYAQSIIPCACGCKQLRPAIDSSGHPRRFVNGHNGRRALRERFWAKVQKGAGCWLWTGCKGYDGYGHFRLGTRSATRAHRVSWELHYGPIPEGLLVCHRCDNPTCVRPDHLVLGTSADNERDKARKGKRAWGTAGGGYNRAKTSCPQGHSYRGRNVYIAPNGSRSCRACRAARARNLYHARRAERKMKE